MDKTPNISDSESSHDNLEEKLLTPDFPNSKTFKHYLVLWSGQLFSIVGSSVVQFVMIWWVTAEYENVVYLSLAAFFGFGPQIFLSPIAGVIADRSNRKIVMALSDFMQALVTLLLIFLIWSEYLTLVLFFIIIAIRSVFQTFHIPAKSSIVPIMVPNEYLSRINGIDFLFTGLIRIIGPILAGLLLSLVPMHIALWVDVLTFAIGVIPLFFVKIPKKIKSDPNAKERNPPFREEFKAGFLFLKKNPALLSFVLTATLANFLGDPFTTLSSFYIRVTHGGDVTDYSYFSASIQIGMTSAALVTTFKKSWRKKSTIIIVMLFIQFLGYLIYSLAPIGNFWIIYLGVFIAGLTYPIINTIAMTIIQRAVPPEMQGRVFSIILTLATIVNPVSMLASGPLANLVGIRVLFVGCAVLAFILLFVFWFVGDMKDLNKIEE